MGEAAAGFSMAATGFKVAGDIFQGFGAKSTAKAQAEAANRRASYGQIKADQTDVAMRQDLESTLGNIMAVRAAAGADPNSPTGQVITQGVAAQGDKDRNRAVGNLEAQSREDLRAAQFYRKSGARAMMGAFLGAGGDLMSGLGGAAKSMGAGAGGGA